VVPRFGVELEQMRFRRWQMADDPRRPGDHFLPPDNWMDDTNGVIQVTWTVPSFYQRIPRSAHRNGGPFHWGYAVSDDLVHWRDVPITISPTANGRLCLTSRVYPTRTDSDRIGWFAVAHLQGLDV